MANIRLGYAPTRRSIFSAPDAIKYRGLTADRLTELGIDFVDITDINDEGLLYGDDEVVNKVIEIMEKNYNFYRCSIEIVKPIEDVYVEKLTGIRSSAPALIRDMNS